MKLKLAVLFGSRSCEHDVSIITALQAISAADKSQYDIVPVYISKEGTWYTGERLRDIGFFQAFDPAQVKEVFPRGNGRKLELLAARPKRRLFGCGFELVDTADVVLLAMHGMNGEDGTLQGMLQLYDVPYTSSNVLGSSVSMDKIMMKQLLIGCGYPVLPYCGLERGAWEEDREGQLTRIEGQIQYPMYVKPANLGSSIGITRAGDRKSLAEAIDVAAAYDRRILVEKGVTELTEVNCAVLGYGSGVKASVLEMPVRWEEFLTFDEKYLRGAGKGMQSLDRRIPAPISEALTEQIQNMSIGMFKALDLKGVVRIDYIIDGQSEAVYVGEVNTIPGSLAYYLWEASGIPFAQLIDEMVKCALKEHADRIKSVFSYDSTILSQYGKGAGAKGAKGAKA